MWLHWLLLTCPMDISLARLCSVLCPGSWPIQTVSQDSGPLALSGICPLEGTSGKCEERRWGWGHILIPSSLHRTVLPGSLSFKAPVLSWAPKTEFLLFPLQGGCGHDFLLMFVSSVSAYLVVFLNSAHIQFIPFLITFNYLDHSVSWGILADRVTLDKSHQATGSRELGFTSLKHKGQSAFCIPVSLCASLHCGQICWETLT